MTMTTFLTIVSAAALSAAPLLAQETQAASTAAAGERAAADSIPMAGERATRSSLQRRQEIQYVRMNDQRGVNVFEAPKDAGVRFDGFKLSFGAAFAQQLQAIAHRNTADPAITGTVNANQLVAIGNGFNLATANLYVNAQLAPGIRVALTSYLSSRRHQDTWVKDGYLQIDASPIDNPILNVAMALTTIKVGHFEINYGDQHFRRSDNGMALFNPFVGNLIMDAFTTEVGGEVYLRAGGMLLMGGMTDAMIGGDVTNPRSRAPAFYGKTGFDRQLTPDLRTRLTGSWYRASKSPNATLFGGDRAGSRYYSVLENTTSTTTAQATSGQINPGFANEISAVQVNPFVKFRDIELFGVVERAKGRRSTEPDARVFNQYAADLVYRFLASEQAYVGLRYNAVNGALVFGPASAPFNRDVRVARRAVAAGWFITPTMLLKSEYVSQRYHDFPSTDIRSGGRFEGMVIEGVVAF